MSGVIKTDETVPGAVGRVRLTKPHTSAIGTLASLVNRRLSARCGSRTQEHPLVKAGNSALRSRAGRDQPAARWHPCRGEQLVSVRNNGRQRATRPILAGRAHEAGAATPARRPRGRAGCGPPAPSTLLAPPAACCVRSEALSLLCFAASQSPQISHQLSNRIPAYEARGVTMADVNEGARAVAYGDYVSSARATFERDGTGRSGFRALAAHRHCCERIAGRWGSFREAREDRLRHGGETEKVAEAILEDLLTDVLDWSKGDITYQVDFADIVLSKNLTKYLVIEVKRPGTLWPGRQALEDALQQARRYADEQRVTRVAASDARFIYAADIEHSILKDRARIDLDQSDPPLCLWWLSVHGIYRPCEEEVAWPVFEMPTAPPPDRSASVPLHPKYKLPAICFAYVGDANDPRTWKLPYRTAERTTDQRRLPKAIQALLSNYRGEKVGGIPETALPKVLQVLARAAAAEGRMPPQASNPAPVYRDLAIVLEQQGLTS
jgi:hypothetical protein